MLKPGMFYFTGKGESPLNLKLMCLIDEQFMQTPFYGSRQMTRWLRRRGYGVGRKRVRRLMRQIGLTPIYQVPKTSQRHADHKVYPYLLRGLAIDRPNRVWCADIMYIPMRHGFLYLMAIMDWHSRKVLAWRSSNTMEASFCVEAVQQTGVQVSMDGKGRWMDNVFIERLWRSLKYECVYLHAWERGGEARTGIDEWVCFYNAERPHSTLGGDGRRMKRMMEYQ